MDRHIRHELEPLEAGRHNIRPLPLRQSSRLSSRACYQAPLRVCRLLVLITLIPSLFILVPLYMRYRVYSSQMYPMGMTDMRLIDSRVSPTWCQRQVVKSNSTFNAFVVPGPPELSSELVSVSMTRQIELKADMKEYWGFYLLQGSLVTVSACVSYPGASLIMIKGYRHLQDCAYIGDDSSEEVDELIKAEEMGLLTKEGLIEKLALLKKIDGKANQPGTMKRHKAGVSFHDPSVAENATDSDPVPTADITEHDPEELRAILEHLHAMRQAIKDKQVKEFQLPPHLVSVAALHRFRDTNVDRDEQKWLTFKDLDNKTNIIDNETDLNLRRNHSILNQTMGGKTDTFKTAVFSRTMNTETLETNKTLVKNETTLSAIPKSYITFSNFSTNPPKIADNDTIRNETNLTDRELDQRLKENVLIELEEETKTKILPKDQKTELESDPDSKEIFEDVLKRLQSLGTRGKRVLKKLHKSMGMIDDIEKYSSIEEEIMTKVVGSSEELDKLRRVLVEAIDEERARPEKQYVKSNKQQQSRSRRELYLGPTDLKNILNEDDGARDDAAEEIEGIEPDGYADHHTIVNETSPLDMSNSEFWSSFSSSEEALLECDGLILNLPLTPHPQCGHKYSAEDRLHAAQRNALTYRVPANGYYFFVFNSENEVQTNFINVKFDLQKTRYDVARTALRECKNSTVRCDLSLDIFSSQKVVLELPLRNNDSLWNEQFVVMSECEPRTSIYLFCVITVPLLIVLFAFQ